MASRRASGSERGGEGRRGWNLGFRAARRRALQETKSVDANEESSKPKRPKDEQRIRAIRGPAGGGAGIYIRGEMAASMNALRILVAIAAVSALLLSGCTGAGQQGVSNVSDAFSYGGQVSGKSGTETFTWHNTQTKALLSWGGQSSSGTFTINIQDAAGKSVYSASMGSGQNGMSGNTASGKAGDWTVVLVFHGFTGQMGLSIAASGGGSGADYTMPTYPATA